MYAVLYMYVYACTYTVYLKIKLKKTQYATGDSRYKIIQSKYMYTHCLLQNSLPCLGLWFVVCGRNNSILLHYMTGTPSTGNFKYLKLMHINAIIYLLFKNSCKQSCYLHLFIAFIITIIIIIALCINFVMCRGGGRAR